MSKPIFLTYIGIQETAYARARGEVNSSGRTVYVLRDPTRQDGPWFMSYYPDHEGFALEKIFSPERVTIWQRFSAAYKAFHGQ